MYQRTRFPKIGTKGTLDRVKELAIISGYVFAQTSVRFELGCGIFQFRDIEALADSEPLEGGEAVAIPSA